MRAAFVVVTASTLLSLGLALPAPAQTAGAAEAPAAEAPQALPAITVTTVAERTLADRVLVSGMIGPVEEVRVAPLIEGQPIETLEADVGDMVSEGQVLARLSATTLELRRSQYAASLASAKATIAQAEAQRLEAQSSADEAQRVNERTATLRAQGTASQAAADTAQANAIAATARVTVAAQSLEAARAQLALVEAQIADVELQLTRTNVVAPVAGEIVARNAQVGAIATAAAEPLFVIVRDGALELRADVAEGDILRLAAGQKVEIRTVGATAALTGTVRLVEPTIDVATRLGKVRIAIDDPSGVRSGMFAEAVVIVAERAALSVPLTAVGSGTEGASVFVVRDGVVTRATVETGIRDDGFVEILRGLSAGDTVVAKAGAFVRDGDRINPVPAPAGTN